MSKYCPFCDEVADSELDTKEKFKQHIEKRHGSEVVNISVDDPIAESTTRTIENML